MRSKGYRITESHKKAISSALLGKKRDPQIFVRVIATRKANQQKKLEQGIPLVSEETRQKHRDNARRRKDLGITKKGWKKRATLPRICKNCSCDFLAKDPKTKFCDTCKQSTHSCPKCRAEVKFGVRYCSNYCNQTDPNNVKVLEGRKKQGAKMLGSKNPNQRLDVRRKIRDGVTASYTPELRRKRGEAMRKRIKEKGYVGWSRRLSNSRGEKFRSKLEVNFSELMIRNGIDYQYEVPMLLMDGSYKIVDFVVNGVLIEISGFAYESWQNNFLKKMKVMRMTNDKQILVLTYPDKVDDLRRRIFRDQNLYVNSVDDEERILSGLKFYAQIAQGAKNAETADHI